MYEGVHRVRSGLAGVPAAPHYFERVFPGGEYTAQLSSLKAACGRDGPLSINRAWEYRFHRVLVSRCDERERSISVRLEPIIEPPVIGVWPTVR